MVDAGGFFYTSILRTNGTCDRAMKGSAGNMPLGRMSSFLDKQRVVGEHAAESRIRRRSLLPVWRLHQPNQPLTQSLEANDGSICAAGNTGND